MTALINFSAKKTPMQAERLQENDIVQYTRPANDPAAPQQPNPVLVDWLESEVGRAQYFSRIDPNLPPPLIAQFRHGKKRIGMMNALRMERAQKPSDNPLKAEQLVSDPDELELLLYARGKSPAPPPVHIVKRTSGRKPGPGPRRPQKIR